MDMSGGEVKGSIDATNEEEAQQKVRRMGYFVLEIRDGGTAKQPPAKRGHAERERGQSSPPRDEPTDRRLSAVMAASEILLVGLKQIPLVGTAIEAVEAIRARYGLLRQEDRIARMEQQLTSFDRQVRGLIEQEIRQTVRSLMEPDLSGSALAGHIRNLRSIRENGYDYALFEGLLRNSPHWADLKANPQNYGTVLGDRTRLRPEAIYVFVDADRTRLLELTPFAFHSLLARQKRSGQVATATCTSDVWAFPTG
jgi:hypothetical protein